MKRLVLLVSILVAFVAVKMVSRGQTPNTESDEEQA